MADVQQVLDNIGRAGDNTPALSNKVAPGKTSEAQAKAAFGNERAQAGLDAVQRNKETVARQAELIAQAAKYNEDSQWSLAIVDNSDIVRNNQTEYGNIGMRTMEWGVNHVANDNIASGSVVRIKMSTGEVEILPEGEDVSEDFMAQVVDFKEQDRKLSEEYQEALEFEQRVQEGELLDQHRTSVLDVICDTLQYSLGNATEQVKPNRADYASDADYTLAVSQWRLDSANVWYDSVKGIFEDLKLVHYAVDNSSEANEARRLYNDEGAQSALKYINALDRTESEKNYLAYSTLKTDTSFANAITEGGIGLLANMGDDLDIIQNPVKATVFWAAYRDGKTDLDSDGDYAYLKDYTLSEAIESCYRAAWQNEGRVAYNFNTGNMAFDMVCEMVTDPTFLTGIVKNLMLKTPAKQAAKALVSDIGQGTEKEMSKQVYTLLKNGTNVDDIAEVIAKTFPGSSQDGIKAILKHSIEYSKQYNIAKSLAGVIDTADAIQACMKKLTGAGLLGKAVTKTFSAIKYGTDTIEALCKARAMSDALTEVAGKYDINTVNIEHVQEFLDLSTINLHTLQTGNGIAHAYMDADTRLELIHNAYLNTLQEISYDAKVQSLSEEAVAAKQKVALHTYAQVLQTNALTDTVQYKLVTQERAALSSINIPTSADVAPTFIKEQARNITDNVADIRNTVDAQLDTFAHTTDQMLNQSDVRTIKLSAVNEAALATRNVDNIRGVFDMMRNPADTASVVALLDDPAARRVITAYSGMDNYESFVEGLKNTSLTPKQQRMVSGALYSSTVERKTGNSLSKIWTLTPAQLNAREVSLAETIVNTAFDLESTLDIHNCNKFYELECNTADLAKNIDNIKALYTAREGITPIFYSTELDRDHNLTRILFDDGTEFKFHEGHVDSVNNLDKYLVDRVRSSGDNTSVLVSFNTHGSGFNTDAYATEFLKRHGSVQSYKFKSSIDLAEEMRIAKGMSVPTQQTYDDVTALVRNSVQSYRHTLLMYNNLSGADFKFKLTSPTQLELRELTQYTSEDLNVQALLSDTSNALKDIDSVYTKMLDLGEGRIRNTCVSGVEATRYVHSLSNAELETHIIYEEALVEKYGTQECIDLIHNSTDPHTLEVVYNAAKAMDDVHSRMLVDCAQAIPDSGFESLQNAWERYVNEYPDTDIAQCYRLFRPANKTDWLAFSFSMADDHPEILSRFDIGVHSFLGNKVQGDGILGVAYLDGSASETWTDLYEQRYSCVYKASNKYTNKDVSLPGRLGRTDTSWDEINKLCDDYDALGKYQDAVLRRHALLETQGQLRPLAAYDIRTRGELLKTYQGEITELYNQAKAEWAQNLNASQSYKGRVISRMTNAVNSSPYTQLGNAVMAYDQLDRVAKIGYISKLSDTELKSFLVGAQGRAYIDLTELTTAQQVVLSERLTTLPEGVHSTVTENAARIWLSKDADLSDVMSLDKLPTVDFSVKSAFRTPPSYITNDPKALNAVAYDNALRNLDSLEKRLSELTDTSYQLSNGLANTRALYDGINTRYFADVADDMIDLATLRKAGFKTGVGYDLSYHGAVRNLNIEGLYTSNNRLINAMNAYTQVSKQLDHTSETLNMIFDSGISGVQSYEDLLSCGCTPTQLTNSGYTLVKFNTESGALIEVPWTHYKSAGECSAIMTERDLAALRDLVDRHVVDNADVAPKTNVLKKAWASYRSAMIATYLYTKPATWIRNWVDSTTKGIINEGWDHFSYMQEAMHVNKTFKSACERIAEDYSNLYGKNVTYLTPKMCEEWFEKHSDMCDFGSGITLSKRRFMQVMDYKWSGVAGEQPNEFFDFLKNNLTLDVPTLKENVWFQFNQSQFSKCEDTNRMAIWLRRMDLGQSVDEAKAAISASQFDYKMSKALEGANNIAPFINFRLKNYGFWLNCESNLGVVGALARTFAYDPEEEYQDDEYLRYRAWIDTCNFNSSTYPQQEYLSYRDFRGNDNDTAQQYGWLKVGENLYFKSGLSLVDAFTGLAVIGDPTGNVFTPVTNLINIEDGEFTSKVYDVITELHNSDLSDAKKADELYKLVADYLPIWGTLASWVYNTYRNANLMQKGTTQYSGLTKLLALDPNLFAPAKLQTEGKVRYTDRPVGVDWYNQSTEYKSTHRYVLGVSYIPTWITKDPATYVNTWGRMMEMGFTSDQVETIMNDGGGFWFTKNNLGGYSLHNYQLMIGNEDMRQHLLSRLVNDFGWSTVRANWLLDMCSRPTWTQKKYTSEGIGSGYRRYSNVHVGSASYNPTRFTLSDKLRKGKNVTYSTDTSTHATHTYAAKTYVKWHHRDTDIYKDLYGKYGASRMAMRQNLKNYSNRSVTELHRTEAAQKYARIHRHQGWF